MLDLRDALAVRVEDRRPLMWDVHERQGGRHAESAVRAIEDRGADMLGIVLRTVQNAVRGIRMLPQREGPLSGDRVGSGSESIVSPDLGQPTTAKIDELEHMVIGQSTGGADLDLGPLDKWDARIAKQRLGESGAERLS